MVWPNRKCVLVPVDFSEVSLSAVDEALTMVDDPSHVHVLHVLADLSNEAEFIRESLHGNDRAEHARRLLQRRFSGAMKQGLDLMVRTGDAGHEIAQAADELGCDLIVMPSHGRRGLAHMLLGSVTERVLRLARCPILVLRFPAES